MRNENITKEDVMEIMLAVKGQGQEKLKNLDPSKVIELFSNQIDSLTYGNTSKISSKRNNL
ncbi:hypothetical protein N9L02_00755 [Gammaproteobacteria bacterium]|nr:hypothetical protein [Gammaproteobacteria bacterium]